MSYSFLRRKIDPSPPITGQHYLPAYAARSQNTLSITTYYTISRDIILYVKSNMASEVEGHVKTQLLNTVDYLTKNPDDIGNKQV